MKITNTVGKSFKNFNEIIEAIKKSLAESKDERDRIIYAQCYITSTGKAGMYPYCDKCEIEFKTEEEVKKHLIEEHISEDEEIAIKHAILWVKNNQNGGGRNFSQE